MSPPQPSSNTNDLGDWSKKPSQMSCNR